MSVTLKNVGSGFKRTAINENFETIESTLNSSVLLADGSNQMEGDLDVNSNRLINLVDAISGQEPATYSQLLAKGDFTIASGDARYFDTVLQATTDDTLEDGDVVIIKDRGSAIFDVVLASGVVPNTFNTIQSTGVGTLALDLRVKDGVANVREFGATGDGVTDDSAAVQSAIDQYSAIFFPVGRFIIKDVIPNTRSRFFGVGVRSRLEGEASVITRDDAGSCFSWEDRKANIQWDGLVFDADVDEVTAIKQTKVVDQSQNYLDNSTFKDLVFTNAVHTCIEANVLGTEFVNINFQQFSGLGGAASKRIAIKSIGTPNASSTKTADTNANAIRSCNFYNGLNPGAGQLDLERGAGWTIDGSTIFESVGSSDTYFIRALGILDMNVRAWFEPGASQEYLIHIDQDTGAAPQGTKLYFGEGSKFHMSNITEACVLVGSASTTVWGDGVTFTGNGVSNYATEKFGVKGDGWSSVGSINIAVISLRDTLFGERGRLDIRNSNVSTYNTMLASSSSSPQTATELVQLLKSGLTDNPGTPETIVTFTLPDTGAGEQGLAMASFVGVLNVSDVAAGLSFIRGMSIHFHLNMFKHNTEATATASVTILNTQNETGTPVLDVTVSGSDVALRFTHNPSGGSFTGGITAVLSGTLAHSSTSAAVAEYTTWA